MINIISIDVGIKNLACCLIEFDKDSKTYNIKKWDVLNLCNETNIKHKCYFNNCNRNVTYKSNDNNYFCNIHAKNCQYILSKKGDEYNINTIKKFKIQNIMTYCKEHNIQLDNELMKNSKKKYMVEKIQDYLKTRCLEKIKITNASKLSLIEIGQNLVSQLNEFKKNEIIDLVLIENQIGPLAIRMKSIQGMITQYFIMEKIYNIEFINSSNKLKLFGEGVKTNYKERKKLSVDNTYKLIQNNNNDMINLFDNHKKKDDLADCFLQSYWYFTTKYI